MTPKLSETMEHDRSNCAHCSPLVKHVAALEERLRQYETPPSPLSFVNCERHKEFQKDCVLCYEMSLGKAFAVASTLRIKKAEVEQRLQSEQKDRQLIAEAELEAKKQEILDTQAVWLREKASLEASRQHAWEITVKDEDTIRRLTADLDYARQDGGPARTIVENQKEEIWGLREENQRFAELLDDGPHEVTCASQWTDAGIQRPCDCWKKQAEAALAQTEEKK